MLQELCACVTLSCCAASAELKFSFCAAAGAGVCCAKNWLQACERLSLLHQPRHASRLRTTSPPSPQHLLFAMRPSSRTVILCFFAVALSNTFRSRITHEANLWLQLFLDILRMSANGRDKPRHRDGNDHAQGLYALELRSSKSIVSLVHYLRQR